MVMGAVCVTVPVVVATTGVYLFDQSHSKAQHVALVLGSRMGASSENMVATMKKEVKKASEMPK
ncbi:One cut domain family [Populus alba x Populus x berolinensis]|nr:One cut domain family [Populus alba x Populus x berolinensis]